MMSWSDFAPRINDFVENFNIDSTNRFLRNEKVKSEK